MLILLVTDLLEKSSAMDNICILKSAMSAVAGGGFGFIMSAFMMGV